MAAGENDDKQSALLSKAQRRYIRDPEGTTDVAESYDRTTRTRLRERVRLGIEDFAILFEHLDPVDRERIFNDFGEDEYEEEKRFYEGQRAMIAFLFLGLRSEESYWPTVRFRKLIEKGVEAAIDKELDDRRLKEIVFEIDTENRYVREAREKYERGEPLELNEILRLAEAGALPKPVRLARPENQPSEK